MEKKMDRFYHYDFYLLLALILVTFLNNSVICSSIGSTNSLLKLDNKSQEFNESHTPLELDHNEKFKNGTITLNLNKMPQIFPKNSKKYHIIQNKTLEDFLIKQALLNNTVQIVQPPSATESAESEIDDMIAASVSPVTINSVVEDADAENKEFEEQQKLLTHSVNKNVETIQEPEKPPPIVVKNKSNSLAAKSIYASNNHLALGLVGVVLLIAICGYISLVLWRRSSEYKYANRELLINEDDYDNFDHRFELMNDDSPVSS